MVQGLKWFMGSQSSMVNMVQLFKGFKGSNEVICCDGPGVKLVHLVKLFHVSSGSMVPLVLGSNAKNGFLNR